MNRRRLLLGTVAGVSGLLGAHLRPGPGTPVVEAAKKPPACPPPQNPDGPDYLRQVTCLPPGVNILTTEQGDQLEVLVLPNGTASFGFRYSTLLPGLYEVYEPIGSVVDRTRDGYVQALEDNFTPPNVFFRLAMWRNSVDVPGVTLRGRNGAPLYLRVDTRPDQPVPDLEIDLVVFEKNAVDIVSLTNDPYPPGPPVRGIVHSWTIPSGAGLRDIPINPIGLRWNDRYLGILRRTEVTVGTNIRLHANAAGLEIV